MNYLFVFGNTPELSQLELSSVLSNQRLQGEALQMASISAELNEADLTRIANKLGGTVKIAKEIGTFDSENQLINLISSHLLKLGLPKIDFGISGYEGIAKTIKRNLEETGIKARFVLPRKGSELSSVVVRKQKLIEIVVQQNVLGQTVWVQDFEEWNRRDFGRPAADPKSGMLPPKVARMMVNISGGKTILDPFCGVGTILAEGLMVGASVIGSDVSEKQVAATKKNLDWLGSHPFKLIQSDARNISSKITEKIDAVVTEPDLGHSTDSNLREKLGYMYISSLEDWKKILKPGGKVVMVIPSFTISKAKELDLVKMVLDRAKIMGYSEFHSPIEYFRKQAILKRNICFLKYGTH